MNVLIKWYAGWKPIDQKKIKNKLLNLEKMKITISKNIKLDKNIYLGFDVLTAVKSLNFDNK